MNRQPEITEATRNRIIDAFRDLFLELPTEKITAGRVAERAGIHRSSFYRYFIDIYQVREELCARLLQDIRQNAETFLGPSLPQNMPEYAAQTAPFLEEQAELIDRFLREPDCGFREAFLQMLRPNLERLLRTEPGEDREFILSLIGSCMIHNFTYWYSHRGACSLKDINAEAMELVLGGLQSRVRQEQTGADGSGILPERNRKRARRENA